MYKRQSESGTEQSGSAGVARLAAEAPSFSLAEEKMQDYSAREDLFFAHTAYIAIGGASAKESLKPFLDYIERSTDLRLDIPLFVVTNGTASELVLGAGGETYDATSVLRSLERTSSCAATGSFSAPPRWCRRWTKTAAHSSRR